MSTRIAIIGGGASGVLTAIALLSADPSAEVVIVEPRVALGRGMAYSTTYPEHVLNVPARIMSAFADDPSHFTRWLRQRYGVRYREDSFVPRMIYGDYLSDAMTVAANDARGRFSHICGEAQSISLNDAGVAIDIGERPPVFADAAVLAFGNAAPAPWPGLDSLNENGKVFSSAWQPDALVPSFPNETVLLLGTGLTAVDAVLGLRHHGHTGLTYMISRRGLLPHEHRLFDTPPSADPDATSMRDLFSAVRNAMSETENGLNWRASVDRMRPRTNDLWRAMTLEDQRRFVRHAMPYWNVHRHRMAPEVAKTVAELVATDQLRMIAGRTGLIESHSGGVCVEVRRRGETRPQTLRVDRLINCSRPQHDIRHLANPLVRTMLSDGLLTPHPLGIGAAVAEDGVIRDAFGKSSDRLFAIGPVRYGTLIETTAIPEIREQASSLALRLTGNRGQSTAVRSAAAR